MSEQSDLNIDFNLDDIELPEAIDEAPASADALTDAQSKSHYAGHLRKMALFSRIPVNLTLEVASVTLSLAELMTVSTDTVVELDKIAGEPLDIKVNGILFGKAEVVVLNDKYGLRIIEFSTSDIGKLAP